MTHASRSVVYSRKYPRVNLKLPAESRILLRGNAKERIFLKIKTLGGGGAMFVSPLPLPVGTVLQMRLHYSAREIDFIARMVWIDKVVESLPSGSAFKCGLMFIQISDDNLARIHRILNVHLGYRGSSAVN